MEKKWWTLVVVCGATFMLLLDITIVIVALPTIQSEPARQVPMGRDWSSFDGR